MLRMPAETPRSEGDAQPDRLTREPLADTEGHPEEPTEDLERVITETRARLEPGVGSQDKEPVGKPLDIDQLISVVRANLRPGGPPVDHPALYAYVAGVLAAEDRPLVAERIATWRDWFEAYIPIRAAADLK